MPEYSSCRATSSQPYEHQGTDYYWKIGIVLPNVDFVYEKLLGAVEVSQPHQFEDIGYMCHFQDPEGFKIELLQQTFGKRGENEGDRAAPFQGANIGQITLRCGSLVFRYLP